MSQLDHIANRIGWRARKNAVWTKNTRMWKDASDALRERVGEALERPVFFSVADESEGVVFGAEGALVVSGEKHDVIPYKDLAGVRCSEVGIAAPSEKEFELKLNVRSKGTICAKVEGGAAGYGVWRVLQMVLNMDEGWFIPEPPPEPEVEETAESNSDLAGAEATAAGEPAASEEAERASTTEAGANEPDAEAVQTHKARKDGAENDSEGESEPDAQVEQGQVENTAD